MRGGIPRIDRSNPLSARLLALFVPGNAAGFDIAGTNNGTLNGSPPFRLSGAGMALSVNTTTQFISLGAPPDLEIYTGNMTLSATFVSRSSQTNAQFIISKDNSSGARGFAIGINNSAGSGRGYVEVGGSSLGFASGPVLAATSPVIHQITVTKNSNTWGLSIDGVFIVSGGGSAVSANSTAKWYLSGRQYSSFFDGFDGLIIEAKIYNRVLSRAEILANFADPFQFLIFSEDVVAAQLGGKVPFRAQEAVSVVVS